MVLLVPFPLPRCLSDRISFLADNADTIPDPVLPSAVHDAMTHIAQDAFVPLNEHRALFSLSRSVTYLNHGSVGAVPVSIQRVRAAWLQAMEEDPINAFAESDPFIAWSLRKLARFIGSDPQDVVFVENATAGTNIVLKSLRLGPQDVVLTISLAYSVVTLTLNSIQDLHGASVHEIEIPLPTTSAEVVRQFELYFEMTDVVPTIAVFDHITSTSALILPVGDLIGICRKHNVLTLVDGAHAMGQVDLNMRALDPDFYVTNCNKWLFSPRGCALLYVKRQHHAKVAPLNTSYGYGHSLQAQFLFPGTHDRSLYLTTAAGLAFFDTVAGPFMQRNRALLLLTATFLSRAVEGDLLTDGDPSMLGLMATITLPRMTRTCKIVRVPVQQYRGMAAYPIPLSAQHPDWVDYLSLNDLKVAGDSQSITTASKISPDMLAAALHKSLREHYGIEVSCYVVDNKVAVRISVHTYNQAPEYVVLAKALVDIQFGDGENGVGQGKCLPWEQAVADEYLADALLIDSQPK